jgi:hypothetical protein
VSADIIPFPGRTCEIRESNGAREAMIEHMSELSDCAREDSERWADYTLADLWMRGFKLVPIED